MPQTNLGIPARIPSLVLQRWREKGLRIELLSSRADVHVRGVSFLEENPAHARRFTRKVALALVAAETKSSGILEKTR